MLLLYAQQVGDSKISLPTKDRTPDRLNLQKDETDLELEASAKLRHTKLIEEISHLRQTYHLERRFLQ